MDHSARVRGTGDRRRADVPPTRTGYILAVSGALAVVTFTLVYLATFSYTLGY